MTVLSAIATWFGMDWRRIIYVVAAPLTVLALYLGAQAYVQAKMDAAVERARSDWLASQRKAEQVAASRAEEAFTQSQMANTAKQKELNNAAQKGDDSSVGAGVNAVLDGLSNDTNRSR